MTQPTTRVRVTEYLCLVGAHHKEIDMTPEGHLNGLPIRSDRREPVHHEPIAYCKHVKLLTRNRPTPTRSPTALLPAKMPERSAMPDVYEINPQFWIRPHPHIACHYREYRPAVHNILRYRRQLCHIIHVTLGSAAEHIHHRLRRTTNTQTWQRFTCL